jgi:hypothetical protein
MALAARVSADAAVSLTLARSSARSLAPGIARTDVLARGTSGSGGATLAYRNPGKGQFAVIVVTPRTRTTTTYTLSVAAR